MYPYTNLFNLISTYIYGGVSAGSSEELVCILVATLGSLFIVALPFAVVWKVMKLFMGGR